MDKETLSHYGWIVILVLILAVLLALASPFGNFIAEGFKATYAGFFNTGNNAMNVVGLGTSNNGLEVINPASKDANNPTRLNSSTCIVDGHAFDSANGITGIDVECIEEGFATYQVTYWQYRMECFYISANMTEEEANKLVGQEAILTCENGNKIPFTVAFVQIGNGQVYIGYEGSMYSTFDSGGAWGSPTISFAVKNTTTNHITPEEINQENYWKTEFIVPTNVDLKILVTATTGKDEKLTEERYVVYETEREYAVILDNSENSTTDTTPMVFARHLGRINPGDTFNSDTYGALPVIAAYEGFCEPTSFYADLRCPWKSKASYVTSVVVEDEIKPNTTMYWFYGFYNCKTMNLEKLNMANVTDMKYMFYDSGVTDLTSLTIGLNTSNMEYAFYNCTSLETAPAIKSNRAIGMDYMFYNCPKLTGTIHVDAQVQVGEYKYAFGNSRPASGPELLVTGWDLNVLMAASGADCKVIVTTKPTLKTVTQGSTGGNLIVNVPGCAYKGMEVVFSSGLERIEVASFYYHLGLEKVTLPKTLKYIGYQAFVCAAEEIYYEGTMAEWKCIEKGNCWAGPYQKVADLAPGRANQSYLCATIHCSDGDISIYPRDLYATSGSHNYVANEGAEWTYLSTSQHQINATCSICGKAGTITNSHTGGTATCTEYKKCTECNEDYGSLLSHSFVENEGAEWENHSDTQHKKAATCSNCGAEDFIYGSHTKVANTGAIWEQYTTSQHKKEATCSVCNGSCYTYASHSLTGKTDAKWEYYSTSQHKKEAICTCGYEAYVYSSHSYTANTDAEWYYYNTSYHRKDATCTCGYEGYVSGSHSFVANPDAEWENYSTSQHRKAATCSGCGGAGYVYASHTGGTATCQSKKICTACNTGYGSLGTCSGGTATCQEKAKCSTCGNEYGTFGPHSMSNGVCILCGSNVTVIESAHNPYPHGQNYATVGTWDYTGAKSVTITITYQTESTSYDYFLISKGNDWVPGTGSTTQSYYNTREYLTTSGTIVSTKATANSAIKFGGSTKTTKTFTVNMPTGSVAFVSDGSVNAYYGAYITISPNY